MADAIDLYDDDEDREERSGGHADRAPTASQRRNSIEDDVDFGYSPVDEALPRAYEEPQPISQPQSQSREETVSRRALYVSQLTWYTTDVQLLTVAEQAGIPIKEVIFLEQKHNGRSQGTCYIECPTSIGATQLRDALLSMQFHGKTPVVIISDPAVDRNEIFKGRGGVASTNSRGANVGSVTGPFRTPGSADGSNARYRPYSYMGRGHGQMAGSASFQRGQMYGQIPPGVVGFGNNGSLDDHNSGWIPEGRVRGLLMNQGFDPIGGRVMRGGANYQQYHFY